MAFWKKPKPETPSPAPAGQGGGGGGGSSSGEKLIVATAYDQSPIQDVPLTQWPEVDAWLERAKQLHEDRGAWKPRHERIAILRNIAARLSAEVEDLAVLIAKEGGKPYPDALVEAKRAVSSVETAAAELETLKGTEMPMDLTAAGAGRVAFTRREPIGPVAAVSAFNHPLNLIAHQVAPAIAAGCPVIVKPAGTTPLSCLRFVEHAHAAGLGEEWCKAVATDNPVAEQMVTDPRVAFFTFIGSSKIGWYLRSKLAPGTRCALEHGGAAPVILGPDADLDRTIPSLVKGGYYHAGQVCVSVQRIFVAEQIRAEVVERMTEAVRKLKVGDPVEKDTEVGPLILPKEVDRVEEWVREAIDGGARATLGAKRMSDTVYAPTVLDGPAAEARVSTQEIFGPVTCVYGYSDVNQAITQANALPVSFQAAVFAQDIDFAMHCAHRLNGAAVMINDHTAFRVDWMPFAGLKESGHGVGGIGYTLHDMTVEKMTVIKSPAF